MTDSARDFEALMLEIEFWCDKDVVDRIQTMTLQEALPIVEANMAKNKAEYWVKQFPWYKRPLARWVVKWNERQSERSV